MDESNVVLDVKGLKKYFPVRSGSLWRRKVQLRKAVDDISFQVRAGETIGLVGESGCGKTTSALCVLRGLEPTAGEIKLRVNGETTDLMQLHGEELRRFRRHIQMIFQDPYESLNPRMTVYEIITEPLRAHGVRETSQLEAKASELLDLVGLPRHALRRYPHAFSGGQRQRVGIARALSLQPTVVVADEPVSALDVSVQAQIINLMVRLQDEFNLSYLLISHDLSVVKHICDRIAVIYAGKIVEFARTEDLYRQPQHPYTEALLSAVPIPDPEWEAEEIVLSGEVPDPVDLPAGCPFHPRCPYAEDRCGREVPALEPVGGGEHQVACLRSEELTLRGIVEFPSVL